jgi:hypothetical protein
MSEDPVMEHPTGEHSNAIDAMEAAIFHLRALPEWNRWITFCAQGEGSSPDSVQFAEVRLLADILETSAPVELAQITVLANVPRHTLTEAGRNRYSIAGATPREAAHILDALFRHQFGIRPFPGEDDDYPVGAEWANPLNLSRP